MAPAAQLKPAATLTSIFQYRRPWQYRHLVEDLELRPLPARQAIRHHRISPPRHERKFWSTSKALTRLRSGTLRARARRARRFKRRASWSPPARSFTHSRAAFPSPVWRPRARRRHVARSEPARLPVEPAPSRSRVGRTASHGTVTLYLFPSMHRLAPYRPVTRSLRRSVRRRRLPPAHLISDRRGTTGIVPGWQHLANPTLSHEASQQRSPASPENGRRPPWQDRRRGLELHPARPSVLFDRRKPRQRPILSVAPHYNKPRLRPYRHLKRHRRSRNSCRSFSAVLEPQRHRRSARDVARASRPTARTLSPLANWRQQRISEPAPPPPPRIVRDSLRDDYAIAPIPRRRRGRRHQRPRTSFP